MQLSPKNSFGARDRFETGSGPAYYYRLAKLQEDGLADVDRLPFSIKVLLESLLRNENGYDVTADDVKRLAAYDPAAPAEFEIPFKPARVVLQDFTGVPAVVDLAALRSAMKRMGGDPQQINPLVPVDLVIDHSVQVDEYDSPLALANNATIEFERNRERYEFLRWGQQAFANFKVVPPASGIVHQVNLEYLSRGVEHRPHGDLDVVFPDSLVGTDSHTTMINGLGVVGWGVGGIEAEAVMLGQPIYMLAPEVVGFKLIGKLPEGSTATDLALVVTQMLRKHGVVGKFVEFFGPGLAAMTLPDRATIANMAPEYGATMGFFPTDAETLRYLAQTGRLPDEVERVERYAKANGLFRDDATPDPVFQDSIELDLATVLPSLAGPKRPQDRILLSDMQATWRTDLRKPVAQRGFALDDAAVARTGALRLADGGEHRLRHGDVVIAAITSCTNTSNPSVMLAAGLVAKKAAARGLRAKPWVKTSLAPGSKVVTEYYDDTGLTPFLEQVGFYTVGYGCTTCIGNSGPAPGAGGRRDRRRRPGRRLRPVGQPELRGPDQPARQGQLPGQPAARRGVRARRHRRRRSRPRAPGPRRRRRPGLPARPVAHPRRAGRGPVASDEARDLPSALRRHRAVERGVERDPRQGGRALRVGRRLDVRPGAAVLRRHGRVARSRSRRSAAPERSSRSATRSPPTTSARPARSPRTRPRART